METENLEKEIEEEMETCTNPCCEGVFPKGTHDIEMCNYLNR